MTLKERYASQSIEQLVLIIESPVDYTEEARSVAKEVLSERHVEREAIVSASRKVLKGRILDYLENFDVINDKLELPKSALQNEEEVKLLFRTVFTEWKNEREDMIPDSWKYVIGAGFG